MICKLCNEFYLDTDSLIVLFSFSEICRKCKVKYQPENKFEVIPIIKGLVEYHYLYENININRKQQEYLSKHLSVLYLDLMKNKDKFDLYIYLDDNTYYLSSEFGDFLSDFTNVYVFSLTRKELMYKDVF